MNQPLEPRVQRIDQPDDVVILEFAGELDLAVHEEVRALVDDMAAERPAVVVADVSAAGFMDSTMLREFLRAHQALSDAGARFVVAGAQPAVRRLFELTGTHEVFTLTDSRESALQ